MLDILPDLWTRCDSLSVWTSGLGKGVGKGTCWMTFRNFVETATDAQRELPTFLSAEEMGSTGHICDRHIPRYCADPERPQTFCPTGRGPWYDYLTVTMDQGQETSMTRVDLQAEYFVPLVHAQAALKSIWDAVQDWAFSPPWGYQHDGSEDNCPPPQRGMVDAMEFRQVKGGDGAWLSPHSVDSLGIHISFNGEPSLRTKIQEEYIPVIEQALKPFHPKPHWGKLASHDTYQYTHMKTLYDESLLLQFQKQCHEHDPNGKFRNAFVERVLFQ